jgi:hypothetical protein
MKSFFGQRRTRCITRVMLFVWLLALGTGIANACVVQENHARHGHVGHHDAVHTATPATATVQDALDHDTLPGKLVCQDFCASGQTGMVKQAGDVPATPDVALALGLFWGLAELSADHPAPIPAIDGPPWAERPIFIRFLRLTI